MDHDTVNARLKGLRRELECMAAQSTRPPPQPAILLMNCLATVSYIALSYMRLCTYTSSNSIGRAKATIALELGSVASHPEHATSHRRNCRAVEQGRRAASQEGTASTAFLQASGLRLQLRLLGGVGHVDLVMAVDELRWGGAKTGAGYGKGALQSQLAQPTC